jgi:cellulose synthase/poly-beta-1,6-N-acetylglucosamine synthase-like glycosyltransferase
MIDQNEIVRAVGTIIAFGFLFVFLAGLYAGFYTASKMFGRAWLAWIGYACAIGQFASAMIMIGTGFLDPFWVKLILFAALAYLVIPPIMWRIVLAFHHYYEEEEEHGHAPSTSFGPLN